MEQAYVPWQAARLMDELNQNAIEAITEFEKDLFTFRALHGEPLTSADHWQRHVGRIRWTGA